MAAIRRISDVEKIQAMGDRLRRAVVIGGGVLGLEAAWELRKAKCEVTVLELAPQIMARQLDDQAAELLLKQCGGQGVRVETGVQIAAIEGDGAVSGVRLENGEVIPADLVVISCGVRANTAIAKEAGITVDRAIVVNEAMETNVPGVYACGDCAQFQGINYALWPEAQAQGKVAAPVPRGIWPPISPLCRCWPSTAWEQSSSPWETRARRRGYPIKPSRSGRTHRDIWSAITLLTERCAA